MKFAIFFAVLVASVLCTPEDIQGFYANEETFEDFEKR
jgi:hypothetical protein